MNAEKLGECILQSFNKNDFEVAESEEQE